MCLEAKCNCQIAGRVTGAKLVFQSLRFACRKYDRLEGHPARIGAEFLAQAADKRIDPALIAAVINTESHFRDQTSHAGATGLMQLMPATADYIAHKSGGTRFERTDLATPQINIAYGTWYLRYLLTKYHGNVTLTLTAAR